MNDTTRLTACSVAPIWLALLSSSSAAPAQPPARPYGIEQRVSWTTSRLTGSPEPPSPYQVERIFPKLKFVEPLEIAALPGSDRLCVMEHAGKILSFPHDPDTEKPDLFADLKQLNPGILETYSIEFHPQFGKNRFVYLWYILKPDLPDGTRVSRFKVTDTNPPRVDLKSEQVVITWVSGGHNGGCMRFGPDGFLYIATGDAAGPDPPDPLNTGQDISDLPSSILRIDVDHAADGHAYRVPPDNPFVHQPGARPEVWAYGFRNPWRMSFDKKSGDLWAGDVGWELWEMIYRVQRGGNYGWSIVEGSHQPVKPDGRRGPTPILPPAIEHPHSEAASITGGCVYRGRRLADLDGAYIYGDWETGKIWELRHDGSRVTKSRELIDTTLRVVSFGEDKDSELLIVDYNGGLYRLAPNPVANVPSTFPRKLSETGLFTSVSELRAAPGVIPYSVNAEAWADHATAERWVALPGTSRLTTADDGRWQFPKDAVLAKTFSLELQRGDAKSRRRLETQVLHFNGDAWGAYSYQWNDEQTDATLVAAGGTERAFTVSDPEAPGGKRNQTWRYQSRAECLRCHNPWSGPGLGFNPLQLNKEHFYATGPTLAANATARNEHNGITDDQLRTLEHLDVVPLTSAEKSKLRLSNPYDDAAGLNERARSWLHANCAHCHREHAGGAVQAMLNYDLPLEKMSVAGARAWRGDFGLPGGLVVAPGDPCASVLYYRTAKLGRGHMPYIGSALIDERGVNLVHDWIEQLPSQSGEASSSEIVKKARIEEASALNQIRSDQSPTKQTRDAAIERLLQSVSGALALLHALDGNSIDPSLRDAVVSRAVTCDPQIRDLFERFLPDEKRVRTLGSDIKPETILALKGDTARGRKLFSQEGGAQCHTCHRIEGVGRDFGADLSRIGQKYNRAQLLENILEPSKTIDPKFAAYVVELKDGSAHTGFLIRKTADDVVLKEATSDEVHLRPAEINRMAPQRLSLMPEGLLQGLTAQEAADLIEYLVSLR